MASPKSGSAGSAVSPADPVKAFEAVKDATGSKSIAEATAAAGPTNKVQAVKIEPFKPPTKQEIHSKKLTWIKIELLDSHGKPVAGENYLIELPDGTVSKGILDTRGHARVDGIEEGLCTVSFPRRHDKAWK